MNGSENMIDVEKLRDMSPEQLERWAKENPGDAEKIGKIMVNVLEKISNTFSHGYAPKGWSVKLVREQKKTNLTYS